MTHQMPDSDYGRSQKDRFRNDLKVFLAYCESEESDITSTAYTKWARRHKATSLDVLRRCFKSWHNALAEVGAEAVKSPEASLDELIDYYMEVWEYESEGTFAPKLAPTEIRFDDYNKQSGKKVNIFTYERRWGRWSEFKKLMSRYQQGLISKEDVKKEANEIKRGGRISGRLIQYVLHRDKYKCLYCGKNPEEHGVTLHVHHLLPESKGGSSEDPENMKTLCSLCNQQLGNSEIDTKGI